MPTPPADTLVAGADRPSLVLRRHFKAQPERVFAAWTDPAHLSHWFCPPNCVLEGVEMNATVGGRYRIAMRENNGELHIVEGTYTEVTPPTRLAFTWAWYTMPDRQSHVTVEVAPSDGGALLTLTHAQFRDATTRDRHQAGWTGSLEALAHLLEA